MKRAVVMILLLGVVVGMVPAKVTMAASDEQYGWKESIESFQRAYQERMSTSRMFTARSSSWDWVKIGESTIETAKMKHYLTTYHMWSQTQDVRWGKVEGIRESLKNSSTYGYVRIRFEGATGNVIEGTDSGRVWGYGYSEATTPEPYGGYFLRAYCGD